jgi:hypothetical protein
MFFYNNHGIVGVLVGNRTKYESMCFRYGCACIQFVLDAGQSELASQTSKTVPGSCVCPGRMYKRDIRSWCKSFLLTYELFCFNFIIHMCIQGLVHFSPLPPPPPLPLTPPPPSPPTPSIPSRNYFALISNFVVERV